MQLRVRFSEEADNQLRELGLYIAQKNSAGVAFRYVAAIVETCYGLELMPDRGDKRDDLLPGMRTIGFKRRVTICFRVQSASVDIISILYGGQDLEGYFETRMVR